MLNSFRVTLANLLDPTRARVREARASRLAFRETEDTISKGSRSWDSNFHDRADTKRDSVLTDVINAWRSNPIAKRIIELTTEFVVGDGFNCDSRQPATLKFLRQLWDNEINDFDGQIPEWADEFWRAGDLFLLGSVDGAGLTYWRAVPAELISDIKTKDNDYRQEIEYLRSSLEDPYPSHATWKAAGSPAEKPFILHFTLNRAIGNIFGESDLVSVLYWIKLYRQWLEDRARLNFFRQMFTFVLKKNWTGIVKTTYLADLIALFPKKSGGILGIDQDEELDVLNPQLESSQAGEDGLAIKRMIATGVGLPMHYLAEPESSTRTTAEAAGTPTMKRFKHRQNKLVQAIRRVLAVSLEIRRAYDPKLPAKPEFTISDVPDITERDNANLALAVQRVTAAFSPLYNAKKITAKELIRLVYRFLAEPVPPEEPDPTLPIPLGSGSTPTGANAPTGEPDPTAQEVSANP